MAIPHFSRPFWFTATAIGVVLGFVVKSAYDDSVAAATRILIKTPTVTSTTAGLTSIPTIQTWAFQKIMCSDEPLRVFDRVYEQGGIAGKIYALTAYRELDQGRFKSRLPEISGSSETFNTSLVCYYNRGQNARSFLKNWFRDDWLFVEPEYRRTVLKNSFPPRPICAFVDMRRSLLDIVRSFVLGRYYSQQWEKLSRSFSDQNSN